MYVWNESLWLRIAVVAVLFVLVALAVFVWNPFAALGAMALWAKIGTLVGTFVAGVSLVLNPLLEGYA